MAARYYIGGFNAAAPAQNKAEEYDSIAGTYTTWDTNGNITSQRALTAAEIARFAAETSVSTSIINKNILQSKAQAAIATNITAVGLPDPIPGNTTYLAIVSPTNPQIAAQVKALTTQNNALINQVLALTKQNTALIRLALGQTDIVTGT